MFKIKDAWQIVEAPPADEGTWVDVRDGQVYPYKQFGNQIWMTVNFNYGGKQGDWVNSNTAQSNGHAWRYKNEQDYENWDAEGLIRGAFYKRASYNWIVPEGWHIPTREEWTTLLTWATAEYGNETDAKLALMAKTKYWNQSLEQYAPSALNKMGLSGFNIVPSGTYNDGWFASNKTGSTNSFYGLALANNSETTPTYQERIYMTVTTGGSYSVYFDQGGNNANIAYAIRLIKDSGAYVPQPAISTITTTLDPTGSDNKLATEKATRSAITSAVSSKMSNPMTAAGDLIVGGTSGAPGRLAIGTQGQVLKVGASGLEWGNETGGMVNPMTTAGDIITGGASGAAGRLGIGTSGQVLTVGSSGPEWASIPTQTGDHKVSTDGTDAAGYLEDKIDAGTNVSITKSSGKIVISSTDTGMLNPMTAAGDIIVGGASGAPSRLASGTTGQVLKVGSNGPEWDAESGQTLYLGAFDSQSRPQSATTGQFILDTDLGYIIYRYGDAWINSTGAIIEGNVQPSNDPVDWIDNPMTSVGDLIVGGTSGQPQRLGVGTEGQVLSVNSSGTSYWRSETDIFNAGHPMTDQADMMVASSNGSPIRFAAAGDGSFLKTTTISGVGKVLQWAPVPVPSVQTFPLSLINNCQPSGTFDNNMNLTKTYSPVTKTISRMGFFHKSGTRGTIGLGIYSASGTKLVSTAMTPVTSATEGHICWINLENSFTLQNGEEFWFAMVRSFNGSPDWSSNIEFGHNTTITGCTNSISIQYYLSAQPVTTMPSTITATQEGAAAIWIVAD